MKMIYHFPVFRFSLLLSILCFFSCADLQAQKTKKGSSPNNCQLDEAKRWYELGDLEKIESIEPCVSDPKSMSREKRIEALQLITESYLYRDKIGAADNSFKKLLSVHPLYEADSTDPGISYDLIYLSRTFSRRPIFSMYFGAGVNFTLVEQLENYGTDNTSGIADHEGYLREYEFGITGAIGFELPLIYNFELALDATFGYRTFAYGDSLYVSVNSANPTGGVNSELTNRAGEPLLYSILSFKENQFWIDVPLMLRYNITKFKGVLPYIYVGCAANFLLSADLGNVERLLQPEITAGNHSIPTADRIFLTEHKDEHSDKTLPSLRNMYNFSFIAGAGLKFRTGRNFIFVDFRYTRMFFNNVDINNRYANTDLLFRYGHVDNDFRMDNFALTVGFIKSFYKPRKKHQHNPRSINNKYNKWLEKERNYAKRETDEDLKRELNSAIKDMERQKPSLIEDVQKGKTKGTKMLSDKQREFSDYKNKRVRVEVKYE
jgi:hypothetical protein